MSPIRIDPDDNRIRSLLRYTPLSGKRVLDIGCGEGDFTFEYAGQAELVIGVDPDLSDLRIALNERPEDLSKQVQFLAARAQALPFPSETFDTAIFTCSL
jgi:ubiquinone/menaquinone biosynthesis C-methylase UbiE